MARVGDVYEIDTPKGKGYFQFWGKTGLLGSLIRVFNNVYEEQPENIEDIVNEKERFWIFFPVEAARRRGYIKRIGKYNIPDFSKDAPLMRTVPFKLENGLVSGTLKKGEEDIPFSNMNEDYFFKLPRYCIVNDTALIDFFSKGWRPEMSRF